MNVLFSRSLLVSLAATMAVPLAAQSSDQAAELAKKLANPIASLVSVPLQYNNDSYGGALDGGRIQRLNVQPILPFSLNDDWNLITRTIVPLVDQSGFPAGDMNKSGVGDTTASQFFSPKAKTAGGWIWGAGPVEYLPTATDKALGGEKWGLGPTAVALKQTGPWTVGFLTNHIWSVAGDEDRNDINSTLVQPFFSYITKTKTTLGAATESTYDWRAGKWSVPLIASVSQLFKVGSQILQFQLAAKYWAEAPANGPTGWAFRSQLVFLFPK